MKVSFLETIEGASGTLVFGNGVSAVKVDVEEARDDHILCTDSHGQKLAVPVGSVAYFRFESDEPC